jgi:hypothetical protein
MVQRCKRLTIVEGPASEQGQQPTHHAHARFNVPARFNVDLWRREGEEKKSRNTNGGINIERNDKSRGIKVEE